MPQQFQQQYSQPQPQYDSQQVYAAAPQQNRLAALRRFLPIIGGVLVLLLFIFGISRLIGGGSATLVQTDGLNASFKVSLPVDWDVQSLFSGQSSIIEARPLDAVATDPTSIRIERDSSLFTEERFVEEMNGRNRLATDAESARFSGYELINANVIDTSDEEQTSYRVEVEGRFLASHQTEFKSVEIQRYLGRGVSLYASFTYSNEYPEVGNSIDAIMESYVED